MAPLLGDLVLRKLRPSQLLLSIVGFVLIAFLLPGAKSEERYFWGRVGDALHVPAFAILALAFFFVFQRLGRKREDALRFSMLSCCVLAPAIELIQPIVGRSCSLIDLLNGWLGVALLLTGLDAWRVGGRRTYRAGHAFAVVLGLIMALTPAWLELQALRWRKSHFPVLASFEDPIETRLWHAHSSSEVSEGAVRRANWSFSVGAHSLQVTTTKGAWTGVEYRAVSQDWSEQRELAFDLFNPGTPFALNIRIDDRKRSRRYGDRYNGRRTIATGWNEIHIPMEEIRTGATERQLDLKRIKRVILFTDKSDIGRTFYLDDVRLLGGKS